MKIDWNIKVGDILTSATIIISVAALTVTWTKDRNTRETAQADAVRSAAALAITKIDRWQSLHLSLYQKLQPEFITTSEMLGGKVGAQISYDVVKVRDYLWKTISRYRIDIANKVLDEEIETSYVKLLSHFPDTRIQFLDMFKTLNEIEERISGSFLEKSQKDIMDFKGKESTYTSAMLGNALRSTASEHEERLDRETTEVIRPVRAFLFDVIAKTNKQILYASRESKNH